MHTFKPRSYSIDGLLVRMLYTEMIVQTSHAKYALHTDLLCKNVMHHVILNRNRMYVYDIVEAHCYFVDIGRTDHEQICSRINNNDCRTFRPRRTLSTAYRTKETAV